MKVLNRDKLTFEDIALWSLEFDCANEQCKAGLQVVASDIQIVTFNRCTLAPDQFGVACPQCGLWNELRSLPFHVQQKARGPE